MNELNEKLAVEVMGALKGFRNVARRDEYGNFIQVPTYATYALPGGKVILQSDWRPTTDLNQLKMCYEAAERGSEDAENFESMVYWHVSEDLRLINKCFLKDIATAIFKHPELVAQAILKAKGVS